jgi:hypothetical protein
MQPHLRPWELKTEGFCRCSDKNSGAEKSGLKKEILS